MKAIAFLFVLFYFVIPTDASYKSDRIHLKDLQVITLHHGQFTTGRRTRPIPQLSCIGGTNRCKVLPQTVQCYNRGWDGQTVQWECKASLDKNLRFNKIDVTCEGYDFAEDDYVLVGSCGLEYSIDTIDGTRPFPEPHQERERLKKASERAREYGYTDNGNFASKKSNDQGDSASVLVIMAIIVSVMYLIYKNCIEPGEHARNRQPTAPPPPGFNVPPPPYQDYSSAPGCSTDSNFGSTGRRTSNSGPGFWSGFSLGNLLGWWARGWTEPRVEQPREPTRTESEEPRQERSWWSGYFGNTTTRRRRVDPSPTRRESFPSSTESSTSSWSDVGTYTASGFGGTKKR